MRKRRQAALLALATALALVLVLVLVLALPAGRHPGATAPGARSSAPSGGEEADTVGRVVESASGFDGAALPPGQPVHAFTLTNVLSGRPVSLSQYQGHVTVLAFPYSTCGAPCALLAQQVRGALDELPHPVPVLFVSADPAADTRARVSRFLGGVSLSGRVQYLSGSPAALRAVWRAYGVVPASAGTSAYANRAEVLVLDSHGGERVIFGLEELTPEALAHDICKLAGDC
jgi:protein SCO1